MNDAAARLFEGPRYGRPAEVLLMKHERGFEMTLSGTARGQDVSGRRFLENVTISTISSQSAVFTISCDPVIDSRLTLNIEIPRTLMLGEPSRMVVSGRVHSLERVRTDPAQKRVRLRLDRKFHIQSPA